MRKLWVFTLFLLSFHSMAEDHVLLMEQANKYYNEGEILSAIETYQTVLSTGFESVGLYYNLGNAYFKTNNYPMAILNYERARKLAPNDQDILFNLEMANSRIVDKIEPLPEFFMVRWWKILVNARSTDQWAHISIITFLLFLLMLLFFLLSKLIWMRKLSFWAGIILMIFFIGSVVLANQRYQTFKLKAEAIVFTPTVTVKSSPRENSTDIFVIHEGIKVSITNQVGEWAEIKIADGSKGWVKESDFVRI
ncbi:MAG: tetratricopeptide repeat protein [Sphingobacteriia bacterium]|nr:tetratricopeptide repeat protein [Sphingobacteriia bacterium]